MPFIENIAEGPVSDLYLAINHYIYTGDYIGAGHALEDLDGKLHVLIPYNPDDPVDGADAAAFRSRMGEIVDRQEQMGIEVKMNEQKRSPGDPYTVITLLLDYKHVRRLSQELVRVPGPLGWGTPKALIDKHFSSVRGKILSGEGV